MPNRMPITNMTKNLCWTRSGVVWGFWRLQGIQTDFETKKTQAIARAAQHALFQSLSGEALLMGLCAHTDPSVVAEKMLAGVDVQQCPEWAEEVLLTMDALESMPVGERAFWLAVPLKIGGLLSSAHAALRRGDMGLREAAALPKRVPTRKEVEQAELAARRVEQAIPVPFKPTPATASEIIWMIGHSIHRGLAVDAATPMPVSADPSAEVGEQAIAAAFAEPILDEGGQSDLDKPNDLRRLNPFQRRYLKVSSPLVKESSYQQILVLTKGPRDGWAVPSMEFLGVADRFPFPVDWAVRLQISSGQVVRRRNQSAENALKDQLHQQNADGETSLLGQPGQLDEVAEALQEYAKSLAQSSKEVEVQATIMYAVGADSDEMVLQRARAVTSAFQGADFVLDAPLGGQEELWWAMIPGIPTSSYVREFAQITTGREFATANPLSESQLGDRKGALVAWNETRGRRAPVLLDFDGTIKGNFSSSFGVVAELGAGKSWLMKLIAGTTIDRGGSVFIIDRTQAREYAKFASSLAQESTIVCDIANPAWSLDPLRIFGAVVGARHVQSLMATMINVSPQSELGFELGRILSPDHLKAEGIACLPDLLRYLERQQKEDPSCKKLFIYMKSIAEKDLGRCLFDTTLPPIDLDARAIVPLTAGLELPSQEEIEHEHLFKQLSVEKTFGRALYTLLTAIAREVCFSKRDRLAGFFVDEAHHVSTSIEGRQKIEEFVRDGRKHLAFVGLGSHDPDDFGGKVTKGLIPIRFVLRQSDEELAVSALQWLKKGLEKDPDLVKRVREETSPKAPDGQVPVHRRGEGFMRDVRQRVGRIRVIAPAREVRREALSSTPSEEKVAVS